MEQVVGLDGCAITCVHPDRVRMVREAAPREEALTRVTGLFKLLGGLATTAARGFNPGCGLADGHGSVDLHKVCGITNVYPRNVFGGVDQPFVVQETNC